MSDTASATVLVQCEIGEEGLKGLLGPGLSLPFPKHAVQVQIALDAKTKYRVQEALKLYDAKSEPKVKTNKERKKKSR